MIVSYIMPVLEKIAKREQIPGQEITIKKITKKQLALKSIEAYEGALTSSVKDSCREAAASAEFYGRTVEYFEEITREEAYLIALKQKYCIIFGKPIFE